MKSTRKTFYFNTGVRAYAHNPPVPVCKGEILGANGVILIPFECDDVPENAIFKFACDHRPPYSDHLLMREIFNSSLVSKFAFFQVFEKKVLQGQE